uniref:Ribosomal protein S16 n=1 Tax=Taxus cuspidata TaxID=99806 RepID=A0A410HY72_TAXCU|nr:ribosomal protein S16 [Taxus cuspidata]
MNKYETRLFYVTIVNFLELGAQPTGTVYGIFLRAKMFRFKHAF